MFTPTLQAHVPLGTKDGLYSFTKPISVFYGDTDWTPIVDDNAAILLMEGRDSKQPYGGSNLHIVTGSAHNFHMDNPEGICKLIIKDLGMD